MDDAQAGAIALLGVGACRHDLFHQLRAHFGGDAASAAVAHPALVVHGAEVEAGRHVAGPEIEAQAHGREGPPADLVFPRVVPKEREVGRTAAGGEARAQGRDQAATARGSQSVQIGQVGGIEFRFAGARIWQAAQAIDDHHQDLGVPAFGQQPLGKF